MKRFLFRHKTKIIVAVLIAAVLTGAFLWGGNYAKSGGNETVETVLTAGETASPDIQDAAEPTGPAESPAAATQEETEAPGETPAETVEASAEPSPAVTAAPEESAVSPTMNISPETGKDQYLTDPVPSGKPLPVEPQDADITGTLLTCTLSVRCDTILDNMELLDEEKWELVPEDGVIFPRPPCPFTRERACSTSFSGK
jgi:hypothetical protein